MSVLEFLQKGIVWFREQSEKRGEGPEGDRNPNIVKFATRHTFTTKDWTQAHAWTSSTRKQIRFLPQLNVFVAAEPGVRGDLNDRRADAYVDTFTTCSWATYDEYTTMYNNISILRSDPTRPELYNCTCASNAKEFTCQLAWGSNDERNLGGAKSGTSPTPRAQKKTRTSTNGGSCLGAYGVPNQHTHTAYRARQQHSFGSSC